MKYLRKKLVVLLCVVVVGLGVARTLNANGDETGDGTSTTVTENSTTRPAKDKESQTLNVVIGAVNDDECSCSVNLEIKKHSPEGGKFKWSKVDGPGDVTFDPNNATSTSTTMTATKGGEYKVKVVYTVDGETTGDETNEFTVVKNENRGDDAHTLDGSGGCSVGEDKDMDEKSDECGNTLTLRCEDLYIARYNDNAISWCRWVNGKNLWVYWKTADGCKFHSGYSRSRDPEGKGEDGDEGKEGTPENPKYDFWWYTWDFINNEFTETHYYGPEPEMWPWEEGVVEVED